jgi:hypothetical protein
LKIKIFVGFDPRESEAYDVLYASIKKHNPDTAVQPIILSHMQDQGWLWREFEQREGIKYDVISDAPCSTEFSISRFLTLHLAREQGYDYAVFMDCDMLVTCDLESELLREISNNPDVPVFCTQHNYNPSTDIKMDGQIQTKYGMKNWSSFVIYNVNHPLNNLLTLDMINNERGLHLHQFCWLPDTDVICTLPLDGNGIPIYNYLVGEYGVPDETPKVVHYTEGVPTMKGYEDCLYSNLWWDYYNRIYSEGNHIQNNIP